MQNHFRKKSLITTPVALEVLILDLTDEILNLQLQPFRDAITERIQAGQGRILFNFRQVTRLNTFQVTVLVHVLRSVYEFGGDLKFSDLEREVSHLIRELRLDQVFEIYSTETRAIQAFTEELTDFNHV